MYFILKTQLVFWPLSVSRLNFSTVLVFVLDVWVLVLVFKFTSMVLALRDRDISLVQFKRLLKTLWFA